MRIGHAALSVAGHVTCHLTAAGGVPNMDRVPEFEMCHQGRDIGRVGVHLVAVFRLGGTSVSAAIMGDHAKALVEEEQHLRVPLVGRERPAVVKDDGLALAPVLEEDLRPVGRLDEAAAHPGCSCWGLTNRRAGRRRGLGPGPAADHGGRRKA